MTKHNLSIDDMRECLENCHGVEEEYLIPATFAADGDPAKFEKVLAYFTDDRHSKFTDPTMRHEEECPVKYELMPEKFTLEINLGNAAMKEIEDIRKALWCVSEHLSCRDMADFVGHIQDLNGNAVGKWELK